MKCVVMEPVCSNTVALVTLSRHAMPLLLSHKTAVFHVALLPGDDTGVAALGSRPGLWWLMAMNCSAQTTGSPSQSHQQDPRENRELQLELTWLQDVLKGKQYVHLRDTTMTFFLDSLYSLFYL